MRADIAIAYISYGFASAVKTVFLKPYLAITRVWVRLTSNAGAQDIGACVLQVFLLTMPVRIQTTISTFIVTRIELFVIEIATFAAYASSASTSVSFKQRWRR